MCFQSLALPGVAEAVQAVQVLRGEEGEADAEGMEGKMLLRRLSLGHRREGAKCKLEMLLWLQRERWLEGADGGRPDQTLLQCPVPISAAWLRRTD